MSFLNFFKNRRRKKIDAYKTIFRGMSEEGRIFFVKTMELQVKHSFFRAQKIINQCEAAFEVLLEDAVERLK